MNHEVFLIRHVQLLDKVRIHAFQHHDLCRVFQRVNPVERVVGQRLDVDDLVLLSPVRAAYSASTDVRYRANG